MTFRRQGLSIVVIAVILMGVSIYVSTIVQTSWLSLIDGQTVTVNGRSWKNIDFWCQGDWHVYFQITSNIPIDAYINYEGNAITIYDWGATDFELVSSDEKLGIAHNTLSIYNPNFLSTSVQIHLAERVTFYPYSSWRNIGYFAIGLLAIGIVLTLIRHKGKSE